MFGFRIVVVMIAGWLAAVPAVRAQIVTTWLGNNANWQAGANWNSGVPNAAGDTAILAGANQATINRGGATNNLGQLQYAAGTISRTITGNAITLHGVGGVGILHNATTAQTIDTGITLAAAQTWQINSGSLTVNGIVGGAGALTKTGGGNLYFSHGSNSFTGNISSSGGQLYAIGGGTGNGNFTFGAVAAGENILGQATTFSISGGEGGAVLNGNFTLAQAATINISGSGEGYFYNYGTVARDFTTAATVNVSGGRLDFGTNRDLFFNPGSTLNATGGATYFYVDRDLTTQGTAANRANFNVSNTATMEIYGFTPGTITLGQHDRFNLDGANASVVVTAHAPSGAVEINGQINLANGSTFAVEVGTTFLRATSAVNGSGTPGTLSIAGDLVIHDDSSVSGLANLTLAGGGAQTVSGAAAGTTSTGWGTVRKTGGGTATLAPSLSELGAQTVVIEGGTLLAGAANQISAGTNMELAGGTWATGGFDQSLATLTLTGDSIIDFGAGASVLTFAAAAGSWTGALTLVNWSGLADGGGNDQLYIGGISSGQLGQIVFVNPAGFAPGTYGAKLLASGEIVPIPEPGAVLLVAGLLAWAWWRERHRWGFGRWMFPGGFTGGGSRGV